jgi:antitoxin VapB
MIDIAKVKTNGVQQVVIIPEDFQILGTEVYIKKIGSTIILFSKDNPWQIFFDSLDQFSDDFMTDRDQPVMQIREDF